MPWLLSSLLALVPLTAFAADPPNMLIVITDDQGYGDLGAHGNPIVKTPKLDAFTKESVWLKNFHVSPVCSPTRSSLLTGQYNYRTGIVDGLRPLGDAGDVKTLAGISRAGYRTGLLVSGTSATTPAAAEDRLPGDALEPGRRTRARRATHTGRPKTAYFGGPEAERQGGEDEGYCGVFTDAAPNSFRPKARNRSSRMSRSIAPRRIRYRRNSRSRTRSSTYRTASPKPASRGRPR